MLVSTVDKDDAVVTLPFWSSKGKPQELQMYEQTSHLKYLEDHLQKKRIQLFWGLPSLHSESLPSAIHVSGDSPSVFIFNRVPNASTCQESSVPVQVPSLGLSESQAPTLSKSLPQSPPMPEVQPQAHLSFPITAQTSGPSQQIRICGVFFHRPQNEPDSLNSSDIDRLEWHLLQKQQENMWGLPALVQCSHKDFCSSPPISPQHRATHVHESISILPGEFSLSDEIRGKLEYHLRKRLIQHRWGLPHRIVHSMSLLMPPEGLSQTSELESTQTPSRTTVLKGQSSKTLSFGLSHSGSYHESKRSGSFQLEKDVGKHQGHIAQKGSKDDPLNSSEEHLGDDSENNQNGHGVSLSGKDSRASEGTLHQNELENVLKVHLSKKFEEINEGRLPNTVRSSLHIDEQMLQYSEEPHSPVGQDSLSSSVAQDYSLNTSRQLSFMHSSAQQLLETHIKRFRLRMLWGLPSKVVESIEIFKWRDNASLSEDPSSTKVTIQDDSKSGGFKSIRGKSKFDRNQGLSNVGPVREHPVSATSHVGRERKGILRHPPSAINHGLAESVQKSVCGRPSLVPVKRSLPGKSSQVPCPPGLRCARPMLPAGQAVATRDPKAERMSFSNRTEMLQGKERRKNLEMLSKAHMSREIFRAEELDAPESKSSDILVTNEPGHSQTATMNESLVETTVTTKRPPQVAGTQHPKSSDLKKKLFNKLKFIRGSVDPRTVPVQPSDIPLSSDNLTLKSSLTHAQNISSGDIGASKVMQAHLVDPGINMGKRQVFENVFMCQDQNSPAAAKKESLVGPNRDEIGGGDASPGSSPHQSQSLPTQNIALEEVQCSKIPQTLSQKGQPPPENFFRKKMKHFLQWIHPGMTGKWQENSQEKGSPLSSLPSRGLLKSRVPFIGVTGPHKFRIDTGKFQESLGYHEALHLPVQTWAVPIHRHHFNHRGHRCKLTQSMSCCQGAVIAGQTLPIGIRSERMMADHIKLCHSGIRCLGQHHTITQCRQLLCPDPFCEVCNRTTAEVYRLVFRKALKDATPSVSHLASTVPVTESSLTLSPAFSVVPPGDLTSVPLPEPSPPPAFTISPNPMTPVDDSCSPSPPGYSLSPKPLPQGDSKFPLDNYPPSTNNFCPLPPHETERVDDSLQPEAPLCLHTHSIDHTLSQNTNALPDFPQVMNSTDSYAVHLEPSTLSVSSSPEYTLSVSQSKSISILKKLVPESSSPDNPGGLSTYVPATRGPDDSSPSCSELPWCQTHDENLFLPSLSNSDIQQEHASVHFPETYLWEGSATKHLEASNLSFLGLNLQDLLERQIKKRTTLQTLEKKAEEEGLLFKKMWPEDSQTSLGNSLKSSDVQEATTPRTGWNTKGKPKQVHMCPQLLYVKTLGKNLQQKYSQLFWGLPSLHSESLVATLLVSSSGSTLDPHFVLFNGIGKVSGIQRWDQESPLLFHSHPIPLSNVHSSPMSQSKFQFHPVTFSQIQPQAHLQSRFPILPSASLSQIRGYGMSFRTCQNESDSPITTENQHLKWHALRKHQECLWGLVSKVHKPQGPICPHPPNIPLVRHTSQACVPVSFLPGHFCMTSESQEKLDSHTPQRLIPHQCLHACRNTESLVLLEPQCKLTEKSQQKGTLAYSQRSELQIQNNTDLIKTDCSISGSFHEREKFHVKDIRQNLEHILGKSSQRISEFYLMKGLGTASDKKSNCVFRSRYGQRHELLSVSMKDTEMKTILRLHLSRKFWQITVGRIPICVCRSWLADRSASLPSGGSHIKTKSKNLANTIVGKAYCQITTLEPYFLDSNTRQVLESHIIRFQVNQMWGLPFKVRESIKFYMLREAKTWPLPQFDFLASAACISGMTFKGEMSKSLEQSTKTFQGNNMRRTKSVPNLDQPCLAISCVGSKGKEDLKISLFDVKNDLTAIERVKDVRKTHQFVTTSITDKAIQTETVLDNICSLDVPTRLTDDGYEPVEKNVNSSFRVEMVQNEMMVEKNSEHFSMLSVSREIYKAEELCAFQSQSGDTLTTTETGSSQEININMIKAETTLATECPSTNILGFRDDEAEDFKKQLLNELKIKLESGEQSKAQGHPSHMPLSSDNLTHKSSQTLVQSFSCGDTEASRELYAHMEDSRMNKKQLQKTRVPEQVSRRCQDKNSPDAKRVAFKEEGRFEVLTSPGSEDSGRGTSKARKKRETVENGELEDTSPFLPGNEQFSTESYLRKKIRQLFQWLDCKRRNTGRESSPQKVKFVPTFAQHQDPLQSAAVFMSYESPQAVELMTAIGKILEEKVACMYESDGSVLRHQAKIEPQVGQHLNEGTLSDPREREWASMKSSSKEAVSADQHCLSNVRQDGGRVTYPPKVVAFPGQLFWESLHPSPSFRESAPHPSPICAHHLLWVRNPGKAYLGSRLQGFSKVAKMLAGAWLSSEDLNGEGSRPHFCAHLPHTLYTHLSVCPGPLERNQQSRGAVHPNDSKTTAKPKREPPLLYTLPPPWKRHTVPEAPTTLSTPPSCAGRSSQKPPEQRKHFSEYAPGRNEEESKGTETKKGKQGMFCIQELETQGRHQKRGACVDGHRKQINTFAKWRACRKVIGTCAQHRLIQVHENQLGYQTVLAKLCFWMMKPHPVDLCRVECLSLLQKIDGLGGRERDPGMFREARALEQQAAKTMVAVDVMKAGT
ncbi:PREDICTED: spermatogenesis-associated protein 31D1 [Condylura cristata]|uniref:spermatogenesis-associated protein 31D1 n=1 Tax=Condylura cristata TaxID=143302 RepID=UPI000643527D|nr:PREDICTED: spermatogenesis-associated protein 31D1 [Condylura cristata]